MEKETTKSETNGKALSPPVQDSTTQEEKETKRRLTGGFRFCAFHMQRTAREGGATGVDRQIGGGAGVDNDGTLRRTRRTFVARGTRTNAGDKITNAPCPARFVLHNAPPRPAPGHVRHRAGDRAAARGGQARAALEARQRGVAVVVEQIVLHRVFPPVGKGDRVHAALGGGVRRRLRARRRLDVVQLLHERDAGRPALLPPVRVERHRVPVEKHLKRPRHGRGPGIGGGDRNGAVRLPGGLGVVPLGAQAQRAVRPRVRPVTVAPVHVVLFPIRVQGPVTVAGRVRAQIFPNVVQRHAHPFATATVGALGFLARHPLKTDGAHAFAQRVVAHATVRTLDRRVRGVGRTGFVDPRRLGQARPPRTIVEREPGVAGAFVVGAARAVAGTGIGTFGKGHRGAQEEEQPAPEEPHRGSIGLMMLQSKRGN